jgi:hypothetical protein
MGSVEIEEKIHRLLMRTIAYYSTRFFYIYNWPAYSCMGGTPLRIFGGGGRVIGIINIKYYMYAYVHYLGNTGYVLIICMKEEIHT